MKRLEKITGYIEVGIIDEEVVINHPSIQTDRDGGGQIHFSVAQARNLARLLKNKADVIEARKMMICNKK